MRKRTRKTEVIGVFSFTPQAAKKISEIMLEKGGNLALSIHIEGGLTGSNWRLTLERRQPSAIVVNGIPVHATSAALKQLDGLIFDWVMTPDGPGLGVYDRHLIDSGP